MYTKMGISDVGLADIISIAAGEMSSNIVDSMAIAEDGEVMMIWLYVQIVLIKCHRY